MQRCSYCKQYIEWATINGQPIPIHPGGYCPGQGGRIGNSRETISRLRPKPYLSLKHFTNPHAKCPVCQAPVFYYQNEHGSKVYFDVLGPPWDKHPCTSEPPPRVGRTRPAAKLPMRSPKETTPNPDPEWQIFLVSEITFLEEHSKQYPYYSMMGLVDDRPFNLTITPSTKIILNVESPFYIKRVTGTEFLLTTLIDDGKEVFSYRVKGFSEVKQARASRSRWGKFEWRKKIKAHNESAEQLPNKLLSHCGDCGKEVTLYRTAPGDEIAMDLLKPPWIKHHCDRVASNSASKKWQPVTIVSHTKGSADRLIIRVEGVRAYRYMITLKQPEIIINKELPLFLKLAQNEKPACLSTVTTGRGGKLYQHFWDCVVSTDKNKCSSTSASWFSA